MAKTSKVLTEDELNERLRMGTKKNILDLIESGKVDDKRMKGFLASWKQINLEMQMKCSERSRQMRFLNMVPKERRDAIIKRMEPLFLTG